MGVFSADGRDPSRVASSPSTELSASDVRVEIESRIARERALLPDLRAGKQAAWARLYDQTAPELFRKILMPRLADRVAAEDALAETFRTAIERFAQFKEQGTGLYPWLARIAHNKAMDMHRARAMTGRKITELTQVLEPLSEPMVGADELLELKVESGATKKRVQVVLADLNPRYARAIELRFFAEKSRAECAELLEVKVGTFDVLLLRALRAFGKVWTGGAS